MGDGHCFGHVQAVAEPKKTMNRAFLVVLAPAVVVSSCWMAFLWGLRVAVPGALVEVAVFAGVIVYVRRKEAGRAESPAARDARNADGH